MPLNEILKLRILTIIIRTIFEEDGKYYPGIYIHDRIDISEGIDINKRNASKECNICHYWHFLNKNFNYEPHPLQ